MDIGVVRRLTWPFLAVSRIESGIGIENDTLTSTLRSDIEDCRLKLCTIV